MSDIQMLASDAVCVGRINEPRVFYDRIVIDPAADLSVIYPGSPGVFRNNDDFPVQIRKILFGLDYQLAGEVSNLTLDERFLQRIGVRFREHDSYYMNRQFVAAPLWSNCLMQAPLPVGDGGVTWKFDHPVVLSARDTLRVRIATNLPGAIGSADLQARVAVHGVGRLTGRPYFFESEINLVSINVTSLDTTDFRNDGAEPVNLTQIICDVSSNGTDPTGDSRSVSLQVMQIGNGTGADWFKGPQTPLLLPRVPMSMIGGDLTRCIVHELPGNGWIWEPGEGVEVDLQRLGTMQTDAATVPVYISMLGHIAVT